MASRTPPIPMANPFQGSFELEDNDDEAGTVLQYMAVKKGSTDEKVQPLDLADANQALTGFNIAGVAQYDALEGEWLAVRYFGVTWAWASENIVRDDPLEVVSTAVAATNGRMARIQSGEIIGPGQMIAGIALENGAEDEKFKIFLTRQVQVNLA